MPPGRARRRYHHRHPSTRKGIFTQEAYEARMVTPQQFEIEDVQWHHHRCGQWQQLSRLPHGARHAGLVGGPRWRWTLTLRPLAKLSTTESSLANKVTRTSPTRIQPYWQLMLQRWNTFCHGCIRCIWGIDAALGCLFIVICRNMYVDQRVLNTNGRDGGPKKMIGGQVQVFPCSPPGHRVTNISRNTENSYFFQFLLWH
jgi:hypothetical protein